jgi:hypothetical protein
LKVVDALLSWVWVFVSCSTEEVPLLGKDCGWPYLPNFCVYTVVETVYSKERTVSTPKGNTRPPAQFICACVEDRVTPVSDHCKESTSGFPGVGGLDW